MPNKPHAAVEALYAPRRTVLDPILVYAARDAGAEVRFGMTVTRLRCDRAGRVTGADGIGLRVARLAGAPVERAATGPAAFIDGYWDGLPVHDYELFYGPGVAAGLFPTNGGQVCVFTAPTLPVRVSGAYGARLRLASRRGCTWRGPPIRRRPST